MFVTPLSCLHLSRLNSNFGVGNGTALLGLKFANANRRLFHGGHELSHLGKLKEVDNGRHFDPVMERISSANCGAM